jgi:hypothetical protein
MPRASSNGGANGSIRFATQQSLNQYVWGICAIHAGVCKQAAGLPDPRANSNSQFEKEGLN